MSINRRTIVILAAMIVAATIAGVAVPSVSVDEAIERVREQLTGPVTPENPTAIWASGTGKALGMPMTASFRYDDDGHFVFTGRGRVTIGQGYDGATTWRLNPNGATQIMQLSNAHYTRSSHWIISGYWVHLQAPYEFTQSNREVKHGQMAIRMRLRDSVIDGVMVIDVRRWLPVYFVVNDYGMDNVIRFESWQRVGERMVPREVVVSNGGKDASRFIMDTYVPDDGVGADTYSAPDNSIDLTFDPAADNRLATQRGRWGHHFVRPRINDTDIGWVAFDTGAGMTVIDRRLARRLKLERIGSSNSTGVGGMIDEDIALVDSIQLGPLTIRHVPLKLGDMDELDLGIDDEMGLLAMDFLSHCVIEYDQANSVIALYDPATYELSGAEWTPMLDHNGKPTISMKFEGHDGLFTIDTGNPGAVLIGQPAVARYNLLDGRKTKRTHVSGIGGRVTAENGNLEWVEWGGHRIRNIPAQFIVENKGSGADRSRDGIIGTDLLRRCRVIFDVPHGRIAYAYD